MYDVLQKENELWRRWKNGYVPDWNHPKDLNEKICKEIIDGDMDRWTELADKVLVRDFVVEKGYGDNLSDLYGVWNDAKDIDFNSLPEKFVIKCNHDSGSSKIIDKKKGFNKGEAVRFLCEYLGLPITAEWNPKMEEPEPEEEEETEYEIEIGK